MNARIVALVVGAGLCSILGCSGAEPTFVSGNQTTYALGTATVCMPLPDNFVEGTSRSVLLKQLSDAGILPTADTLGCYVDEGALRQLESSGTPLPFWAKVVIFKRLRDADVTAEQFAKLKADATAKMEDSLDLKSPRMQELLKQMQGTLSNLSNGSVGYELPKPLNLGMVQSSDSSFTSLMLVSQTFTSAVSKESIPIIYVSVPECQAWRKGLEERSARIEATRAVTDDDGDALEEASAELTPSSHEIP